MCGVPQNLKDMIKSLSYNKVMSMHNSGMKCIKMHVA